MINIIILFISIINVNSLLIKNYNFNWTCPSYINQASYYIENVILLDVKFHMN